MGNIDSPLALKRSELRLRVLSQKLLQAQEDERRRIARELHDVIGQSLTVLKLVLHKAKHSPPEQVNDTIKEAEAVTDEAVNHLRYLVDFLRPSALDDLGLLPALQWYFDHINSQAKIHVHFKHSGLRHRFPDEVSTAAFRILQEALADALPAGVTRVAIQASSDSCALALEVKYDKPDSDIAPDPISRRSVADMRERTFLLGGKLVVKTSPGGGSCIAVKLPIKKKGQIRGRKQEHGNINSPG